MDASDGLTWIAESRMLSICDLPRSTVHKWVELGLIEAGAGGTYTEAEVIEATIVAALRKHFSLEDLTHLWTQLRREGHVGDFVARATRLDGGQRYDVVVDPLGGSISVVHDDEGLARAVRDPFAPRAMAVIPLGERLSFVRNSFRAYAIDEQRPTERHVGRPARRRGQLRSVDEA